MLVPSALPDKAALLIAPSGALVEDAPALDPLAALLSQDYQQPTVLQDVISAIRRAAEDDRISAVVLDLENVAGPTTSQTVEISAAIAEFKEYRQARHRKGRFLFSGQLLIGRTGGPGASASRGWAIFGGLLRLPSLSAHVFRTSAGHHACVSSGRQ